MLTNVATIVVAVGATVLAVGATVLAVYVGDKGGYKRRNMSIELQQRSWLSEAYIMSS
jgi:hypothetical protein